MRFLPGTFAVVAVAIGAAAIAATAQSAPPPGTTAELLLKDGKTTFRSGEPITLEIKLRTNESGCFLVTDTNPSPMDTVELTPIDGAHRWVKGDGRGSDASGWSQFEANVPVTIEIVLNDLYRFDERKSYTVSVKTRHLHCGTFTHAASIELEAGPVTFEVEPFGKSEEKELADSVEQRIREATDEKQAHKLARQLDYLPGDDATQAKLSLYLHPKTFYPFGVDVTQGLWIARNRGMVVSALEQAVADPTSAIGASSGLLTMLVALKRDPVKPQEPSFPMPPPLHPEPDSLMAGYVHQIALSLPQRTGESLLEAATTVFESDAADSTQTPQPNSDFQAAREVLITHFADVNEYSVAYILRRYGTYLEDRRLIPPLQNLIAHSEGIFSSNRDAAVGQMRKIAPELLREEGDSTSK